MTENSSEGMATTASVNSSNSLQEKQKAATGEITNNNDSRRGNERTRRENNIIHVSKTYEGDTPEIGAVLALQNENVDKKANFSVFCERIGTYIMKEYKNGEDVVAVTKDITVDIVDTFKTEKKPDNLTAAEKRSEVDVEIKKEEIKAYVRDLKTLESNLKKIYSLVFGNCTDGVRTLIKSEDLYEEKSKLFDCVWILKTCKSIVCGVDTKASPRLSLHTALLSFLLLKQYGNESNDAYLTRFKSSCETLILAGGAHIFVSEQMMNKKIADATTKELVEEKEKMKAIFFILRSDESRYKDLLKDLKSSAYRGRDEYPTTLTNGFDLLVRESGIF